MEWYYIILLIFASLCTVACVHGSIVWCCIRCKYINRRYIRNTNHVVNHTLTKVEESINPSIIKSEDFVCDNNDYLVFHEYKIENTIFPKEIEDIIKEYVHYRLIRGFTLHSTFALYYPAGFIVRRLNSQIRKIVTDTIFTSTFIDNEYFYDRYNLSLEDGFEIPVKRKLLDIKIQ